MVISPAEHRSVKRFLLLTIAILACGNLTGAQKALREVTAKADADFDAGRLDTAIEEYNRVMMLHLPPQLSSIALMRRGNCYYAKHDLTRAISDYDQALRLDPKNAGAYDNRANALEARGDSGGARRDYAESVRLNPRNSYLYLNRGSFLMEQGDFAGALADYAKTLAINPREETAHIGRTKIYLMQCKREEALKEANAAISLAPRKAVVYACRASVYAELRRYSEAEADIKRALRLKYYDPTTALSLFAWFRATCPDPHFRNGKEALEVARRFQSTNFYSSGPLNTLAAAYAEVGDFDQAVKYQTQAIETAPRRHPMLPEAKERLELYKKHKPFRDEPRKTAIQAL